MMGTAAGSGSLAQRASGLVVPAHLAGVPEEPAAEGLAAPGARDADGRRRIVLTRETRKRFSRTAADLDREDLAFVLVCKGFRYVGKEASDPATGETSLVAVKEPIPGACGEVMLREGEDTLDPGFGCKCTRIHFTKGSY
jgi:hypothetical protein